MKFGTPTTPDKLRTVVLHAGDFHFGGGHTRISTLLGSCVSITLWHPRKFIGGMCHYMMTENTKSTDTPLDCRYASDAFTRFLQHIAEQGTKPREYQAKLFGGGNMFKAERQGQLDIGERNIACGLRFLAENGVTLMSSHVGGSGRRKLHFDLWSGDVWLSYPDGKGAVISSLQDKPGK